MVGLRVGCRSWVSTCRWAEGGGSFEMVGLLFECRFCVSTCRWVEGGRPNGAILCRPQVWMASNQMLCNQMVATNLRCLAACLTATCCRLFPLCSACWARAAASRPSGAACRLSGGRRWLRSRRQQCSRWGETDRLPAGLHVLCRLGGRRWLRSRRQRWSRWAWHPRAAPGLMHAAPIPGSAAADARQMHTLPGHALNPMVCKRLPRRAWSSGSSTKRR